MKFEWDGLIFDRDEPKNVANMAKHGRSFKDAYLVWKNPYGELLLGHTETEERWVRRGSIGKQVWLCVYAIRDDSIRVMSFRPAHAKERKIP